MEMRAPPARMASMHFPPIPTAANPPPPVVPTVKATEAVAAAAVAAAAAAPIHYPDSTIIVHNADKDVARVDEATDLCNRVDAFLHQQRVVADAAQLAAASYMQRRMRMSMERKRNAVRNLGDGVNPITHVKDGYMRPVDRAPPLPTKDYTKYYAIDITDHAGSYTIVLSLVPVVCIVVCIDGK